MNFKTTLADGTEISTVDLSAASGMRMALRYESVVFGPVGSAEEEARYSTEKEAIRGHYNLVREWTEKGNE